MSRFLRRAPAKSAEVTSAEAPGSLPPSTSDLILYPHPDAKVPVRAPHTAEQLKKLSDLESFTRDLHTSTLTEEDSYWRWEERWLDSAGLYARYMRAAKWDLANAKKRIQATLEWRREFKPDLIVPDEVKIEGETGKHVLSGFDRRAMPLLYLRPGRENTKPSDRQIRYLVWSVERALDFLPPGQDSICLVIDYKSATVQNNPSFGTSLKCLQILQNHYVERLGRAYVSSVPWFINAFFKAIQPFLDPITRDKIRFNANLPEFIPPEHLDCEWEGGRYNYSFDPEKYWDSLVEFCGIAPDGTRVHESLSKECKTQVDVSSPASKSAAAALSNATEVKADKDEAPKEDGVAQEGQTFSTFVTKKEEASESPSVTTSSATTATAPGTNASSAMDLSRDGSLQTQVTEQSTGEAAEGAEAKVDQATAGK